MHLLQTLIPYQLQCGFGPVHLQSELSVSPATQRRYMLTPKGGGGD